MLAISVACLVAIPISEVSPFIFNPKLSLYGSFNPFSFVEITRAIQRAPIYQILVLLSVVMYQLYFWATYKDYFSKKLDTFMYLLTVILIISPTLYWIFISLVDKQPFIAYYPLPIFVWFTYMTVSLLSRALTRHNRNLLAWYQVYVISYIPLSLIISYYMGLAFATLGHGYVWFYL